MPSFTSKAFNSFYKNLLGVDQSSNTGVDTTPRRIQDGAGNNTSMVVSDDVLYIYPNVDNTSQTFKVVNVAGTTYFAVDTNNKKVLVGESQVAANTQYTHFGMAYGAVSTSGLSDDTHYAIPFNGMPFNADAAASFAMGTATTSSFNDTEPATTLTISDTAMSIIQTYWYVMDDITIDRVVWWQGADAATGSSTAAYLMGYTADATTASTGGDLSSGVKLASSSTVTNAGYEQAYYNQMTIHSADVDAGKVILFTFCFDDTEATDYTINATVKFHIR